MSGKDAKSKIYSESLKRQDFSDDARDENTLSHWDIASQFDRRRYEKNKDQRIKQGRKRKNQYRDAA